MDNYAVIGNPINHSKSPQIHQLFAEQTGIDHRYGKIEATTENFAATVKQFQANGGRGLNITAPFKDLAFQLADQLTEHATAAQTVNTFTFLSDGKILGDNTDGIGFYIDLTENLKFPLPKIQNILLIGAGGSAKGLLPILLENFAGDITITNRTVEKAQELKKRCSSYKNLHVATFKNLQGDFDLVINCTTMSQADFVTNLSGLNLTTIQLCYDLAYSDELTPFLTWAKKHNLKAVDGTGMLVKQAAESFLQWHGIKPDTKNIIEMASPRGFEPLLLP